jgi:hypothetical protein
MKLPNNMKLPKAIEEQFNTIGQIKVLNKDGTVNYTEPLRVVIIKSAEHLAQLLDLIAK